jgi:hypothetical protein
MGDTPEDDLEPWRGHPMVAVAKVAWEFANLAIDRRGIGMAGNNGPDRESSDVERTFAGILSELEDVATALTVRQTELARELGEVESELHRIEAVRSAMTGGKPAKKPRAGGREKRPTMEERSAQIIAWARERGDDFTVTEAAQFLGMKNQGIGPILAGMAKRGELAVRESADDLNTNGTPLRIYSVA